MGFEVDVEDMNSAAKKLGDTKSPSLPADGAPNVGETDSSHGYAADYNIWLVTRQEDLEAGDRQVEELVRKISEAAKSYDATDKHASEDYLKALDSSLDKIDR